MQPDIVLLFINIHVVHIHTRAFAFFLPGLQTFTVSAQI